MSEQEKEEEEDKQLDSTRTYVYPSKITIPSWIMLLLDRLELVDLCR